MNPISSDVAKHLLMIIEANEKCAVTHLEMSVSCSLVPYIYIIMYSYKTEHAFFIRLELNKA